MRRVPKSRKSSEMGTRIRQPITGPARVPPPPTTVAAMGMMEKSRANWLMPAHMYTWASTAPPRQPKAEAMNTPMAL